MTVQRSTPASTTIPRQFRRTLLWRGGRRAASALEFALVAPVFMLFLFAVLGAGIVSIYQVSLDDAVFAATRQIQIDGPSASSPANFVAAVCGELGALAGNCQSTVTYNVQASSTIAGFSGLTPAALSGTGAYPDAFFSSGPTFSAGVNVLVQVAFPLPFKLPLVASLVTGTGTASITASVAVRVERF